MTTSISLPRHLRQAGALVGATAGGVVLVLAIGAGLPSGSPTPSATPATPATPLTTLSTTSAVEAAGVPDLDATGFAAEAPVQAVTLRSARPGNGAVLTRRGSGAGRFTVDNAGGDVDAVVTLSRGGRATLVLYVRAGARASASKVPDGTFDVFVQRGRNWDAGARRFTETVSTGEFDRKAEFDTQRTRGGTRYSIVTVTLQSVPGGNASESPVPQDAVPA